MQLLIGAAVHGGGRVTPLPTRTAYALCRALGLSPDELSATGNQAPRKLIFVDNNPAFRLRLRKVQPIWNAAALEQLFRSHRAGAVQGDEAPGCEQPAQ